MIFSLYATSPALCTVVSDMKSKSLDVAVICDPVTIRLLLLTSLQVVGTIFKVVSTLQLL